MQDNLVTNYENHKRAVNFYKNKDSGGNIGNLDKTLMCMFDTLKSSI
jgi:hypothetical protein